MARARYSKCNGLGGAVRDTREPVDCSWIVAHPSAGGRRAPRTSLAPGGAAMRAFKSARRRCWRGISGSWTSILLDGSRLNQEFHARIAALQRASQCITQEVVRGLLWNRVPGRRACSGGILHCLTHEPNADEECLSATSTQRAPWSRAIRTSIGSCGVGLLAVAISVAAYNCLVPRWVMRSPTLCTAR
jgi:hypothetical protein